MAANRKLEDQLRGMILGNQRAAAQLRPDHVPQQQMTPPPHLVGNYPGPPPGLPQYYPPYGGTGPPQQHPGTHGPPMGPPVGPPPGLAPQSQQMRQFPEHYPRASLEMPAPSAPRPPHGPPGFPPVSQPQHHGRHPHAPHGRRFFHATNQPSVNTGAPVPTMADFPPLGEKGPVARPAPVPTGPTPQREKTYPGQRQVQVGRRHAENAPPRIHRSHMASAQRQQAYRHYWPEQARLLDELAKQVLPEATPPESETAMKKQLLDRLEAICKELDPGAELVPFGSLVTGFATASSDIDCVFSSKTNFHTLPASIAKAAGSDEHVELPELLQKKLEDEGFETTLLTKTRIPIIKLKQKPTKSHPVEMQCDIGFKNQLAVHNTHLLRSYASCDERVKPMVLFIKWWTKKRRINSPYRGTLSSYGYVLMVLHYLINVVEPPVLPNLQLFPVPAGTSAADITTEDSGKKYNTWFRQDVSGLPPSRNRDSLGELLRGFFDYYAFQFRWSQTAISIRSPGGIITKEEKDWIAAKTRPGNDAASGEAAFEVKDRYLVAIEDPFEISHNVGRTCTGKGSYRIREEFIRAMKYLKQADGGKSLRKCLFEEAPPEKPFVRKEDKKESGGLIQGQSDGTPQQGAEVPLEVAQDMPIKGQPAG